MRILGFYQFKQEQNLLKTIASCYGFFNTFNNFNHYILIPLFLDIIFQIKGVMIDKKD